MSEHIITEEVKKAYASGIRRFDVHLDDQGWTYQVVICSLIDLLGQLFGQLAVSVAPVYPAQMENVNDE